MNKSQLNAISYAYSKKRYEERLKNIGKHDLTTAWLCYVNGRSINRFVSLYKVMSDFCHLKAIKEILEEKE